MTNPLKYATRRKLRLSSALLLVFGFYLASGWFALSHQAQHHSEEISELHGHHSCHHTNAVSEENEGIALSDSPDHEHCYFCALTLLVPSAMDLWSNGMAIDRSTAVVNSEPVEPLINSRDCAHAGRAPPVKI